MTDEAKLKPGWLSKDIRKAAARAGATQMTYPQCITDEVERAALIPIMADLIRLLRGPVKADRWIEAIAAGAIVRRSTLTNMDVDLVALARYVWSRDAKKETT